MSCPLLVCSELTKACSEYNFMYVDFSIFNFQGASHLPLLRTNNKSKLIATFSEIRQTYLKALPQLL